jgi:hypothetical protein
MPVDGHPPASPIHLLVSCLMPPCLLQTVCCWLAATLKKRAYFC